MNVTVVNPTGGSFLTVWPTNLSRPLSSNLNWISGQGPTPNQVTSALSPSGSISIFNNTGTVDVIVDITGYITAKDTNSVFYTKTEIDALVGSTPGPTGPSGPVGPVGPTGPAGQPGVSGYEVVVALGSFTYQQIQTNQGGNGGLRLPGPSCPTGKKLINQSIVWGGDSAVDVDLQTPTWRDTYPVLLTTLIDTANQQPIFWIGSLLNSSGSWFYKAKSICVTA